MNINSEYRGKKIPWMKFGLIAAVFIGVALFSGRAGLEKLLNLKPGTLGGGGQVAEKEGQGDAPNFDVDTNWKNAKPSDSQNRQTEPSGRTPSASSSFKLTRDGFVMRSPAGLTYYVGDRGENRLDHVLLHTKDNLSKPTHGIFDGTKDEIFELIDEAYTLVKSNSPRVGAPKPQGTRVAYDIDMQRRIGYKGGQKGRREGPDKLTVLRLVLDKEIRVITAFPAR